MSRRIASLFFVLALSIIVMADAKAQQNFSNCGIYYTGAGTPDCPSVSAAIAGLNAQMSGYCAAGNYSECPSAVVSAPNCVAAPSGTRTHTCQGTWQYRAASGTTFGQFTATRQVRTPTCPSGQQFNPHTNQCDTPCSSKPPMQNVRFQVTGGIAGSACSGGCEYIVDLVGGSGPAGLTTIGGVQFYRAPSMVPSGSTCTVGNSPIASDGQACATQGSLTQCVKPDGRHCATSSSGKEFCWQPGENGIKASGNEAATKSPPNTEIKAPPLPPNNGGEWTQTGQSTVTTTVNNNTQTSNVTGWQSSYGSQGQGANGNGANGEGNSGNGSGSGLGNGNGNGNGNGDDDEDDDGPGGPGAGVGDLYSPTDKTVASVFGAFKARVSGAPLISAINSFFTVNASGGCPVFNVPGSDYWSAMSYDAHCSGGFLEALQAIGWVLMAVAAFFAAMWALS